MHDSQLGRILRSLRRSPGFVAIATLSLGAALGLSTAVFAFIDSMTHPASPIRDVGRVYEIRIFARAGQGPSRSDYERTIADVEGIERTASAKWAWEYVEAGNAHERMFVAEARAGFFDLLAMTPRIGRLPRTDETARNVAVVGDKLWRAKFGNRASLDGATVLLRNQPYQVIGVMPFRGEHPRSTSVWIPDQAPDDGGAGRVLARLASTAREVDVQLKLDAAFARLSAQFTTKNEPPIHAALVSLRPDPLELKDFHRAMVGSAFCVLLVACANVAALMLARGTVRTRDYALRLALGSSRRAIASEVLTEVGVLAVAGSVVGAFVATWTVSFIARGIPAEMEWLGLVEPQWSIRVFGLAALCVIAAVAGAGAVPAWRASRIAPAGPLKETSGGTTHRAGTRFRWLVVGELAVTMMLLMVTSLTIKSALQMASDRAERSPRESFTLQMGFTGRDSADWATRRTELTAVLHRVRQVPGVTGASLMASCPVDRNVITTDRWVEGAPTVTFPSCSNVGADYVIPAGERILDGRDFTDADREGTGALILDSLTAAHLFPGERAVGRMIKLGPLHSTQPWLPIVGVIAFRMSPNPVLAALDTGRVRILAALPIDGRRVNILVASQPGVGGVALALGRIGQEVTQGGRGYAFVTSSTATWQRSYQVQRFLSIIFTMLGGASLVLGAAGLFGVLSYVASQRMREFAIRIALGSTEPGVLGLVLRDGLIMGLGGTAFGAFAGMKAGFLIWERMYGDLYPVDVGALVAAEAVLLAVTVAASIAPAVRAMRANPVEVMRAI